MTTFVKICGICSEGDLEQISALRPDAIGFNHWPKSKRYISPVEAGKWETPEGIKRVGVFVCPTEAELAHAAQHARLDVIQVHQVHDNWKLDRNLFQGLEVWRAATPTELYHAETWFEFDRFLLDSFDEKTVGGTGKICDWNMARTLIRAVEQPILLAGGLSPENVAEAIAEVSPWGVDVASGVEIEPGVKDMDKVKAFIENARNA